MSVLAIIPARGGSKRIPRKNIKDFLGSPIIKYSIESAIKANLFDEIMVSTDDSEIAQIAQKYGAKVPFFRSSATSGDLATTAQVIEEVILQYKKMGRDFLYCCCIYPAAPFITSVHLTQAFELLRKTGADAVVPVVRYGHPIQRALKIEDGRLFMLHPENLNIRTQDLMASYHDVGQFYCLKVESLMKNKKLVMDDTLPFILQESEIQDIDSDEDWQAAEIKFKILKEKSKEGDK